MNWIEATAEAARARGIRPWIAIKEELAATAIEIMADAGETAVLQGGAALHFCYGSPRLSADVDYVGREAASAMSARSDALVEATSALVGRSARWSMSRVDRLTRGKITIEVDAARRIVLPIEVYDVVAHQPRDRGVLGVVEAPDEIVADKLVASASRLARRGAIKTTDIYDLWFATERLGAAPPPSKLVRDKLADYGEESRGADVAAAFRAVSVDELRATLEGVLPGDELDTLDPAALIEAAAELAERFRDVL